MGAGVSAEDLAFAGVAGQAARLRAGELSSRALVDRLLERIARLDPRLRAFRVCFPADARRAADAADVARASGDPRPLLGVPVAVKDTVAVAGSAALLGTGSPEPVATADGEVVRRLRAAGLIVLGATNLPELALWGFTSSPTHGVTRNPWDLDRVPGGSSGGSAAAVAAGLVPAAHGSDGLGSIRIPAAACGLVGLKPTHGLLPLEPDPEHWQGLSHTGVLTRTVEDTALLLDVLAGGAAPGLHAGLAQRRPLRIAWSVRAPAPARVHPEVRNALDATVERLRSLGHDVRQADPPYGELVHVMMPRYLRGAAEDLAGLVDPGATERRTRAMARLGRLLPDSLLRRAHRDGSAATARLEEFFSRTDVLLTPATAGLPIRADRLRTAGVTRTLTVLAGWVPFTQAWNITGQPALVVPAGMSSSGLPLAVQLVARRGADSTLLALGAALEELTGWAQTRPALEGPGR